MTVCPSSSTRFSRSMAIIGSSSMMRTSVAIAAAISRPDSSTSARTSSFGHAEDLGRLPVREPFERDQQERLPRQGRDLAEMPVARRRRGHRIGSRPIGRVPDAREDTVKVDARFGGRRRVLKQRPIFAQGFKGRGDVGIARRLASRQSPRIAPQVREILGNCFRRPSASLRGLVTLIIARRFHRGKFRYG